MTLKGPELRDRLREIDSAGRRLRRTVESLDAPSLARPSLCEGWSRGHVLAHVALNAHSLVNLVEWARTGVETPQYAGRAERAGDIERFSGRSKAEHLAALADGAAALAAAAEALPLDRWAFHVRGIGGDPQPVSRFLFGRLREVEVHHVDLASSYGPADWEDSFVRRALEEAPDRLAPGTAPGFTAVATDLGESLSIGGDAARVTVEGPARHLLAWLLGRSDGTGLDSGGAPLPRVPPWG